MLTVISFIPPLKNGFPIEDDSLLPQGILDDYLWDYFDPNQELTPELLVDLQSDNYDRGIVAMRREIGRASCRERV